MFPWFSPAKPPATLFALPVTGSGRVGELAAQPLDGAAVVAHESAGHEIAEHRAAGVDVAGGVRVGDRSLVHAGETSDRGGAGVGNQVRAGHGSGRVGVVDGGAGVVDADQAAELYIAGAADRAGGEGRRDRAGEHSQLSTPFWPTSPPTKLNVPPLTFPVADEPVIVPRLLPTRPPAKLRLLWSGRIADRDRDIGARSRDRAGAFVLSDQAAGADAGERQAVHAAARARGRC